MEIPAALKFHLESRPGDQKKNKGGITHTKIYIEMQDSDNLEQFLIYLLAREKGNNTTLNPAFSHVWYKVKHKSSTKIQEICSFNDQ